MPLYTCAMRVNKSSAGITLLSSRWLDVKMSSPTSCLQVFLDILLKFSYSKFKRSHRTMPNLGQCHGVRGIGCCIASFVALVVAVV